MLREVTAELANVRVDAFHGLLVDFCRDHDIPAIVKGLRAVSDFDYELQMAQMNRRLAGVETVFVPTNPDLQFLSSSLVKEVATWGGDVSGLVPDGVATRLHERLAGSLDDPAPAYAGRPTPEEQTARGRAREARRDHRRWSRTPARCRCRRPASSTAPSCSTLLEELRALLPEEFDQAEQLLAGRDRRSSTRAAHEADRIIAAAEEERDAADLRDRGLRRRPSAEADRIRAEAHATRRERCAGGRRLRRRQARQLRGRARQDARRRRTAAGRSCAGAARSRRSGTLRHRDRRDPGRPRGLSRHGGSRRRRPGAHEFGLPAATRGTLSRSVPIRGPVHRLGAKRSSGSSRLDPRAPLVVDTRELGRRPGSMRTAHAGRSRRRRTSAST